MAAGKLGLGILVCMFMVMTGCKSAKMKQVKPSKSGAIDINSPQEPFEEPDVREEQNPSSPRPVRPIATGRDDGDVRDADELDILEPTAPSTCEASCGTQQFKPQIRPMPRPKNHGAQTSGQQENPNDASLIDCGEAAETCPKPKPVRESCADDTLHARVEQPKLDILFVIDTSKSLHGGLNDPSGGELAQLAGAMQHFVNSLDERTDIRIGMLLGHGPNSSAHGRLFKTPQDGPAVIDFNQMLSATRQKNPRATEAQLRQLTMDNITKVLSHRMRSVPNERGGAQGEALLLSLYNVVTKPEYFSAIQNPGGNQPGLFRPDVPLAVIMVSDEQDVCFKYEGSNFQPPLVDKVTGKDGKVTAIPDRYETAFFASAACQRAVEGRYPLTPGHVYDALKKVVGEKLIMTSIVYVDNNVPQGVEDENEMGHGFLELTALAGGQVANIANVKANQVDASRGAQSFNELLQQLGKFADFKMRYEKKDFKCESPTDPVLVDPSTVEARVYNDRNELIALFKSNCRDPRRCDKGVTGQASWKIEQTPRGQRYGVISLNSEKLQAILESQKVQHGTVRMSFVQKYIE